MDNSEFENCVGVIKSLVGKRFNQMKAKRPDVEYSDLLSEGYEIYSWCLKNYDSSNGAKFTTYLYQNLRGRLADYYDYRVKELKRYNDMKLTEDDELSFEDTLSKDYQTIHIKNLLEEGKAELSCEAYEVLKYIVMRNWERKGVTKVSMTTLKKHFHMNNALYQYIWSELESFWYEKGWKIA